MNLKKFSLDSSYLFNNSNGLNWKDLYEKLKQIKLNWARSNFRVIEFKGHKNKSVFFVISYDSLVNFNFLNFFEQCTLFENER